MCWWPGRWQFGWGRLDQNDIRLASALAEVGVEVELSNYQYRTESGIIRVLRLIYIFYL